MLDIKYIQENLDQVKETASFKHTKIDFDSLLSLSEERKKLLFVVEDKKRIRNEASEQIAKLKKEKQNAEDKISEMKGVSQEIKDLDAELSEVENKLKEMLLQVPNIAHPTVPKGSDESTNEVVKEVGEKKTFSFPPKDHIELGEKLGYFDFKRAAKISGSGFALFKGAGAKLERALIQFLLDFHTTKHSYTEMSPPFIVNRETMTGTGQLPKMEEDMYCTDKGDDLFLIPTAEVPVTNYYRDEMLQEKDLPIQYCAYTPCYRREAGSYGKDTKGLQRLHQFDKVELVKFAHPDDSYEEHEKLLADVEAVLQALGLNYRVLLLSAGDMSFAAAKCYDVELWSPATETWLEVSSCSNFEDFQARRANIRFKDSSSGKNRFIHTLNASGVALPRLVIALMENYQQEDGSIAYPETLKPYLSQGDIP